VELPALWIREDLPPDLTGLCFNCLLPADHISRNCTRETACLRCRKGGHHAKDCPEGRAPVGVGQRRPDRVDRQIPRQSGGWPSVWMHRLGAAGSMLHPLWRCVEGSGLCLLWKGDALGRHRRCIAAVCMPTWVP
jgi:hypothetical protein